MPLRLVNFLSDSDQPRCGAWTDEGIVDLGLAARRSALALADQFTDAVAVLSNADLLETARELVEAGAVDPVPREAVRLLAPVPRPGKLFALAGNYLSHIAEGSEGSLAASMEQEWRGGPRVFMKPSQDCVIADGEPIILAKTATFLDYEAEMAVIIGKAGRYIPPEDALSYVGGITAFNDVSERQLSVWDRGEYREKYKWFDWLNGKWTDTSAPMGPCAVPLSEVPDLNNLNLRLELNGQVMQEANTSEMIFKVPEVVSYMSNIVTLRPGDVISMGTPAGVGMARGVHLQEGDVVTVELDLVGRLSNPVIADRS